MAAVQFRQNAHLRFWNHTARPSFLPPENKFDFRWKMTDSDATTSRTKIVAYSSSVSVVGLILVIIGAIYNSRQESCDNTAILFLLIHGSLLLAAGLLPCCSPVISIADLGVVIWGMVTIFGAYSTWQYANPSAPGFCPQVPFIVAFVDLILVAVLIGLCLIGLPFLCCLGLPFICCFFDDDWNSNAQMFNCSNRKINLFDKMYPIKLLNAFQSLLLCSLPTILGWKFLGFLTGS